tara:strand:- start:1 stop:252 length:252 start_codon:yes stop_codon:yes gene_type:complete
MSSNLPNSKDTLTLTEPNEKQKQEFVNKFSLLFSKLNKLQTALGSRSLDRTDVTKTAEEFLSNLKDFLELINKNNILKVKEYL